MKYVKVSIFYKILSVAVLCVAVFFPSKVLAATQALPLGLQSDGMGNTYIAGVAPSDSSTAKPIISEIFDSTDTYYAGGLLYTLTSDTDKDYVVGDSMRFNSYTSSYQITNFAPDTYTVFFCRIESGVFPLNYACDDDPSVSMDGTTTYEEFMASDAVFYYVYTISSEGYFSFVGIPPACADLVCPVSPVEGDTTLTAQVLFVGTYTNTDSYYSNLLVTVEPVGGGTIVSQSPYIQGGTSAYSVEMQLSADTDYTYTVRMCTSGADCTTETAPVTFTTGGSSAPLPYEECEGITDIGCNLRNVFIWAFVPSPSVMQNFAQLKLAFSEAFPFAYISDVLGLVSNPLGSAEYLPTVDIETGFGAPVEIVSQSSIEEVIPEDVADLIKGLLTMSLWLGFALYVYNKAKGLAPKD